MWTFGLRGKDFARMNVEYGNAPPRRCKYSALTPGYLTHIPD
jgi:hypothetical protein